MHVDTVTDGLGPTDEHLYSAQHMGNEAGPSTARLYTMAQVLVSLGGMKQLSIVGDISVDALMLPLKENAFWALVHKGSYNTESHAGTER